MMRYPIGIQSFETNRKDGYGYDLITTFGFNGGDIHKPMGIPGETPAYCE
jgi:hypothetical protein